MSQVAYANLCSIYAFNASSAGQGCLRSGAGQLQPTYETTKLLKDTPEGRIGVYREACPECKDTSRVGR